MKTIHVYIAGPYSSNPKSNTYRAINVADQLWRLGYVPFVPHLTHFWEQQHSHPYEAWLEYDLHWLRKCDVLLRIPGKSGGADGEVAEARRLDIPVVYEIHELERMTLAGMS